MGHSARKEKLEMVFPGQFDRDMLPEGRRTFPYVHCNIQDGAFYHSYKLCLGIFSFLEMEASDNP